MYYSTQKARNELLITILENHLFYGKMAFARKRLFLLFLVSILLTLQMYFQKYKSWLWENTILPQIRV